MKKVLTNILKFFGYTITKSNPKLQLKAVSMFTGKKFVIEA